MSSEHVEVLRHMKDTIKAIMPSEVAALDAAIAALSAPQPPAEAQPVGEAALRCTCPSGDGSLRWPCPAHPPEAQGGGDMTECGHSKYDPCHNCEPLDAPPSTPVGVERILAEMREEGQADIVDGGVVLEWEDDLRNALAQQPPAEAQPVAWLVRWQHGRKRLGITIADSVAAENYYHWRNGGENNQPVELLPLYTAPPSAPVGVAADILRIVDTAIDVCNDRDRPAMAEDLEAVRLYVEQASAPLAQQPAAVDGDWRKKAAEWLEAKAVEQEAANQKWPSHAACYKEWRDRPGILRHLAIQVLAAQSGGSDNDR